MDKSIIISAEFKPYFTARVTLAALGLKINQKKMLEPGNQKA